MAKLEFTVSIIKEETFRDNKGIFLVVGIFASKNTNPKISTY